MNRLRMKPAKVIGHLIVLVLLASQALGSATPSVPPNILLITVDTLRADRLGCYGYAEGETPAIDALARDGVLFEHAIAQVPLTWPSHAAIMTGTYPFSNGVQDFTGQPLSPDFRTLAESLKDQGYATGAVVSAFVLDRSWGLDRGFDSYYDAFSGQDFLQKNLGLVDRKAKESVDQALEWLNDLPDPDQPFFLWLHLFDPHSPYDPPEPYRSRYRQRPYDGEVAYMDNQLGRVFRWMEERGLYENALIVFVSDHGESLGEHGEAEHGFFVYNSTVHVPLIVKPPAAAALPARRIPAAVETLSLAPTILDLAAIQDPIQKQFQAGSLLGLMTAGKEARGQAAYSETFYPFSSFGWSPLRSLQTASHHYIEAPEAELYDLHVDPEEKHNLASEEPDLVASLRQQFQQLVGRHQQPLPQESTSGLSAEAVEKLRSLGYVAYRSPAAGSVLTGELSDPKAKLAEYNAILQATDALQAGDYDSARSILAKVQDTDPEIYLIPFLLGQAASRQGDWTSAATEFEKSLKLNPNFDQAMTGLARALHRAGKHVPAQRWLRRALRLNPNNYRAWYQLARVQSRRDKSAAAASLQKVLSIQPNFSPALRDLGLLRIQEKKYTEAAKNLEKAVQFGLTDPATHNYLGIAYSRTNRLGGAVDSYRRALASDPDFAEAHLNLALAYQRLKRIADAQREYEIACRLKKNFCQYVPRPQE